MKIQVIGVGVVGGAQAYLASKLGHEVIGVDRNRSSFDHAKMFKEVQQDADVTFICTQEAVVPAVVQELVDKKVKGLYVIKSTVPSGTTKSLMDKHNIHICHNPEFLVEAIAFETVANPSMVAIGQCCLEHSKILKDFYTPIGCPIVISQPTITETVKLTLNSYLSTLISFWNQIDKIAKALGVSTREVADIVTLNPRVSKYGTEFFGSPFGGKCLPKDMDQLIVLSNLVGSDSSLLEAIRDFNKSI